MIETGPVASVRAIYEQWQEGSILNSEELKALRVSPKGAALELSDANSFADQLKLSVKDTLPGSS